MTNGPIVLLKLLMAVLLVAFAYPARPQQPVTPPHRTKPVKSGETTPPAARDAGAFLPLTGGTLTGPLQLAADPTAANQASTKNYVDQQLTTALPVTGGSITGMLAMQNWVAKLPRVDVRHVDFMGGADPTGVRDSTAAIQAAINFAIASAPTNSNFPVVYLPAGNYRINGTLTMPTSLHLEGDSKGSAVLQQYNPTASLIIVKPGKTGCGTAACYGGIQNIALKGSGKLTVGSLLEMQDGDFILRDIHFYNTGGRGLQMNSSAERVVAYDLSFFYVRWPIIMAGDDNEDYFFNTHIWGAGETDDLTNGPAYFNHYCYSINCTAGTFNAPGTQGNPTTLYPDPHGAVYIDKAVNVAFVGGSIKAGSMISGVRVWNASVVKFQNIYHEDVYVGQIPRSNRAYILAGKAEQTYLTSSLSGTSLSAAVNDASWMPQFYGQASDAISNGGNYYPYVILPQDYNSASTGPSAYLPGLQQNQYELINIAGFAADGNMYVQSRNMAGSTAPAGTQWPAGSIVEQYGNGFEGSLELDNVHINQVQGPGSVGGYTEHCDQTNVYACGEILAGYAPDVQAPSTNPALNQTGFYAPLGNSSDPIPYAQVSLRMRNVEMFNSPTNPYVGQIAGHHYVAVQIDGGSNLGAIESANAVNATGGGQQLSISAATGGSFITAPQYVTGRVAGVTVSLTGGGEYWDSASGYFSKKANVFGPYQQYGAFMNGEQFQNLYCLFDTPAVTGGHVANRFCVGGGPGNTSGSSSSAGTGAGIEYNSWNGSSWSRIFSVSGANGVGSMNVGGSANVSGALNASTVSTGGVTDSGALSAGAITGTSVVTTGNISSAGTVSAANMAATGSVAAGSVTTSTLAASGNVSAASVSATSVSATGTVAAGAVTASTLAATGSISGGTVNASNVTATGTVAANAVSATNVSATGTVSAGGVTTSTLTASGNVSAASVTTPSVTATGTVAAGTLTASKLSVSGSVSAGPVSAASVAATGAVTAASLSSSGGITAGLNTLTGGAANALSNSLPKVTGTLAVNSSLPLVWSSYGPCGLQYANCGESGPALTFPVNVVVQSWKAILLTAPANCTTLPTLILKAGSTTMATMTFTNGSPYGTTSPFTPQTIAAGVGLQIVVGTADAGCSTNPSGVEQFVTYSAAD